MTHDVMGPCKDHKGVQDGAGILEMTRQVKQIFLSIHVTYRQNHINCLKLNT